MHGLDQCWREKALECDSWRQDIAVKTVELNAENEIAEQHRKDENRRRCVERLVQCEAGLACGWPGCTFTAVNGSGLVTTNGSPTAHLMPVLWLRDTDIRHQVCTTKSGSAKQSQR